MKRWLALFFLLAALGRPASPWAADGPVRIGVLANRGLERLHAEGRINMSDYRALAPDVPDPEAGAFPFALSTPLYPEWPMARLSHTPDELARRVAWALLGLGPDTPAARASQVEGWTIPLSYWPVEDLLKELKVGPFQRQGQVLLAEVWVQHRGLVLATGGFLLVLALAGAHWMNRRLARYRSRLEAQLKEREEILARLSQANSEMNLIFNTAAGGMRVLAPDGTILKVNDAFCRMTGWSREEAEGRHCREVFAESTCQPSECTLAQVAAGQEGLSMEVVKNRRDGTPIHCEMTVSSLRDADGTLLGVIQDFRDITERVDFQARLTTQNALLTTIIETIPEPFFYKDSEGRYRMVNQAFARLLGREPGELLGRTLHEVNPEAVASVHSSVDRLIMDDASTPLRVYESVVLDGRGQERSVLVHKARVAQAPGRPPGLLGLLIDITGRKRLDALREDVERMTRHDLKTPLGAVINLPDLILADGNLTPDQRDSLTLIRDSGRRMLNMINMSFDLFRMEQGTYVLKPGNVDLLRLVRAILEELRSLRESRLVTVRLRANGEEPGVGDVFLARGEEMLLYCLVSNLIKNALEASPRDGIVTVALSRDQGTVLSVANQGAVPLAVRETFFEKYATSGKEEGTGLGTYSIRLIAQVHGGSAAMRTSEQDGTTVTVRLPDLPEGPSIREQAS